MLGSPPAETGRQWARWTQEGPGGGAGFRLSAGGAQGSCKGRARAHLQLVIVVVPMAHRLLARVLRGLRRGDGGGQGLVVVAHHPRAAEAEASSAAAEAATAAVPCAAVEILEQLLLERQLCAVRWLRQTAVPLRRGRRRVGHGAQCVASRRLAHACQVCLERFDLRAPRDDIPRRCVGAVSNRAAARGRAHPDDGRRCARARAVRGRRGAGAPLRANVLGPDEDAVIGRALEVRSALARPIVLALRLIELYAHPSALLEEGAPNKANRAAQEVGSGESVHAGDGAVECALSHPVDCFPVTFTRSPSPNSMWTLVSGPRQHDRVARALCLLAGRGVQLQRERQNRCDMLMYRARAGATLCVVLLHVELKKSQFRHFSK